MKKIISIITVILFVLGSYFGYQYFKIRPFAVCKNYNSQNLEQYLQYSKQNPNTPENIVVELVNNGFSSISYTDQLYELYQSEDFQIENLQRYINVSEKSNLKINEVIEMVNLGIDQMNENIDYQFVLNLLNNSDYDPSKLERYIHFNNLYTLDINDLVRLVNYDIDLLAGKIALEDNLTQINQFLQEKYYIHKNLKRYLDYYQDHPSLSSKEIVKRVNSNIDYNYFTHVENAKISDNNLILCNKYSVLNSDYIPDDLITLSSDYSSAGARLKSDAAKAFMLMCDDARAAGYNVMAYGDNGYRSYDYQASLYNYYASIYGTEGADECSARPGYSEHQTGLAIDIQINGDKYASDYEYSWVFNNCYKYGFIYRYQEEEEYITGYQKEQWHYRYVGVDAATYIYENSIDYEEYYAYFVEDNSITTEEFLQMFE